MTIEHDWKPEPDGLQQISQLLKRTQSIDNTVQKNTKLNEQDEATRSLSGLILKNNAKAFFDKFPDYCRVYKARMLVLYWRSVTVDSSHFRNFNHDY
ncbi:unnamed protein product, partial [Brachionus calyciflorus]